MLMFGAFARLGNHVANGENKFQSVALRETGLLESDDLVMLKMQSGDCGRNARKSFIE
jgi:hypothetical protein